MNKQRLASSVDNFVLPSAAKSEISATPRRYSYGIEEKRKRRIRKKEWEKRLKVAKGKHAHFPHD